jgi:hypothetical protein
LLAVGDGHGAACRRNVSARRASQVVYTVLLCFASSPGSTPCPFDGSAPQHITRAQRLRYPFLLQFWFSFLGGRALVYVYLSFLHLGSLSCGVEILSHQVQSRLLILEKRRAQYLNDKARLHSTLTACFGIEAQKCRRSFLFRLFCRHFLTNRHSSVKQERKYHCILPEARLFFCFHHVKGSSL